MSNSDKRLPVNRRREVGLIVSALAALLLLYASSIIVFDVFGDHVRFSNRSLAVPAFGLAVVSVWYLSTRYPWPRGWLRLVTLVIAVFVCYLAFGEASLGIRLLV
jgi:hypothetical protein